MAGTSKYYEVKQQIEAMIRRGELKLGDQLPSEPELAETFNVSRGTIRQALGELARDGVIARRSGAGTFVIRKPTKEARVVSFTKQVRAARMEPSTRILKRDQIMAVEAEGRVCEAFFLDKKTARHTPVYRIDRLRCGDDRPLARQTVYLLASDFKPDLLEGDLTGSIFDLYARYHRQVAWADEIIQARAAAPEEIELLHMQALRACEQIVYVRDRISYDQENRPLEVLKSIDRADFFQAYRYRIVEDEQHFGTSDTDQLSRFSYQSK
jgi:GntR family transcriptional regulator